MLETIPQTVVRRKERIHKFEANRGDVERGEGGGLAKSSTLEGHRERKFRTILRRRGPKASQGGGIVGEDS